MDSINFTESNKRFCLKLHYNGENSYLFVKGTEIYKFKAKDSEIVVALLCLGNISTLDSRWCEKGRFKWICLWF